MCSYLQFCFLSLIFCLNGVSGVPITDNPILPVESENNLPLQISASLNSTVFDPQSKDAFSSFIIQRRSPSDPLSHEAVQKRATSRAMLRCHSPEDEARWSRCTNRPGGSSKGVTIFCRPPNNHNYWKSDSCLQHEICIQGQLATDNNQWAARPTAYCVSTQNFVDLAMDARTHETVPKTVDMSVPVALADGTHIIEAVVTSADGRVLSKGASIHMSPQKKDMLHDIDTWRSVGKDLECIGCVRLKMPVVPIGTMRIDVNVGLHAGTSGGKLWLVGM